MIAVAAVIRKNRTTAGWILCGGMLLLSLTSLCDGFLLRAGNAADAAFWERISQFVSLPAPAAWLAFSLCYARGNSAEFLFKWRYTLVAALLLPLGLAILTGLPVTAHPMEAGPGWWVPFGTSLGALNLLALGTYVLAVSNLEKTLRAAAGTVQWRIKFAVLGLAFIFAARIYTATQGMLFSGRGTDLVVVEALSLILGCTLLVLGYARRGFADLDVYPSRAVLQSSVTILLVGGYLVAVGVLAQALGHLGAMHAFRAQAFLVLIATIFLGVLLLSSRLRLQVRQVVTRHFHRPAHDYREVWTKLTQSLSTTLDQRELAERSARLIAGTFDVLSVDVWTVDPARQALILGASTTGLGSEAQPGTEATVKPPSFQDVLSSRPVNLDDKAPAWARVLGALGSSQFRKGGSQACVPLIANEELIGIILLSDRVDGRPYELDEFDMLQCIGDQVAAAILRIRMTSELMLSKELEAFQTMSAFFVHDLKNAAASLSLTLENLPVHFNDPAFRSDAFRGIGRTVTRIHQLIARLSTLRNQLELRPTEVDLNELVVQAFQQLAPEDIARVTHELRPLPKVKADPEQLQSVISNLLLNARDAVHGEGHIRIQTCSRDGHAILSIEDDGCGMSEQFMRDSLFRPFQSTKKNGLGIGMFQSRQIIKAHCGSIDVESALGHGTRFRVSLPAVPPQS
jgi:putative PEP-CTERM system histidine kinase